MRRRLALWWLRLRESGLRNDIILASERRREYLEAAHQLEAWVAKAHVRRQKIAATIASLEDPQDLIREAIASKRSGARVDRRI